MSIARPLSWPMRPTARECCDLLRRSEWVACGCWRAPTERCHYRRRCMPVGRVRVDLVGAPNQLFCEKMPAWIYAGVAVKVWLALIILWTEAVPAFAETDSGTNGTGISYGFAVLDGDTVKFGRQRVRLFGADAPEKGQPCNDGHWYAGPLATKALIAFIAGHPVSWHQVDYHYKNNPSVAVCIAGKDDLQALMGSAGWAWAFTAYSDQYVDAERRGGSTWRRRSRASLPAPLGVAGAKTGGAIVRQSTCAISRAGRSVTGVRIRTHRPYVDQH
jgi:hypothetical protein